MIIKQLEGDLDFSELMQAQRGFRFVESEDAPTEEAMKAACSALYLIEEAFSDSGEETLRVRVESPSDLTEFEEGTQFHMIEQEYDIAYGRTEAKARIPGFPIPFTMGTEYHITISRKQNTTGERN